MMGPGKLKKLNMMGELLGESLKLASMVTNMDIQVGLDDNHGLTEEQQDLIRMISHKQHEAILQYFTPQAEKIFKLARMIELIPEDSPILPGIKS